MRCCQNRLGHTAQAMLAATFVLLIVTATLADDGATRKQRRLDFIRETIARLEFETTDVPLKSLTLPAEPVLSYTNPVRSATGSGSTFLVLDGVRPIAAASASIRDNGKAFREMTLLRDIALNVSREEKLVWQPKTVAKPWELVPNTSQPAKNSPLRLIQMRQIVRRFEMALVKQDMESGVLRSLSKPIYRYSDPDSGLVDGAVFAFVESTDPEALLLLEAHSDDTGRSWRYTIARMTSRPSKVMLDKREIWTTKGYWKNPKTLQDSYCEAFDSMYEETESADIETQVSEVGP